MSRLRLPTASRRLPDDWIEPALAASPPSRQAGFIGRTSRACRTLSLAGLASLALLEPQRVHAATLYWDLNEDAANVGTSATGTWDGVFVGWNSALGGGAGTNVAVTTSADDLIFSSGTNFTDGGTITLSGAQVASSVTFEENEVYTLTGGTSLTIGGTGASDGIFLTTAADQAVGISTPLVLNGNNTIQTAGAGVLTISGGLTGTGNLVLNNNATNAAGITVSTGSLDNTGTLTNSGTGAGGVTVSSVIGTNVTSVTQNSATSTLTLSGPNTYTGATTVTAGTLNVQNATGLGTIAAGTTVADNAALQLQGGIAVGAETLSLTGDGTGTNTGALVNFSGDNSYAGLITIQADGTRINSSSGTLTLDVASGNAIESNGSNDDLELGGAGNITINDAIATGAAALTKDGAGTLTLNAANTYTGTTTVNAGSLTYGVDDVISSGPVTVAGGTLAIGTFSDTVGTVTLSSGSITGSTGVLTGSSYALTDTGSISAILGGGGTLTKSGAGTATLTGANSYTGTTTISLGVLNVQNATGLGTTAAGTTVSNTDSALQLQGGIAIGAEALSLSGDGIGTDTGALVNVSGDNSYAGLITIQVDGTRINSTAGTLTLDVAAGNAIESNGSDDNLEFGGAGNIVVADPIATGAATVTKDGAGTLTLLTANTFTAGLTVSGGTVVFGDDGAAGSGTLTLGGATVQGTGGARNITNNLAVTGNITFSGAENLTFTDSFDQGADRTYTVNNTTEFSGAVTGSDDLDKSGTGTLILSGSNDLDLVNVNVGGALRVANDGALGTTGFGTDVDSGGALELIGGRTIGDEALALDGTGVGGNGALRNISGDNSWAGLITISIDTRINSDAGTLTLDRPGVANAIVGGAGDDLTFGGDGNITVADAIATGASTLTKDGAGILTLTGANTYTGTTTISNGTLSANDIVVTGGASSLGNATSAVVLGSASTTGTLSYTGGVDTYIRGFTVTAGTGGGALTNTTANLLTLSGGDTAVGSGATMTFGATGTGGITLDSTSIITGAGGNVAVNSSGAGVVTLSGVNTYTGTTTVTSGRLQLGASGVIADASNVVLAGGTLGTGGFDETVGTLTLSSSSVIDMGAADSILTFASIASWAGTLSVWNWTGTINTAGGTDQLHFTTPSAPGSVQFYSDDGVTPVGAGGAFIGDELVPVPEPGALLAGLLLLAPVAWRERRFFLRVRQVA